MHIKSNMMAKADLVSTIFIIVAIVFTIAQSDTCDKSSTICCPSGKYAVGCNNFFLNFLVSSFKYLGSYTLSDAAGCWCQNNGPGGGPACPAWLTCPDPLKVPIILGYNLENFFSDNACHCQCVPDECGPNSEYTIPQDRS